VATRTASGRRSTGPHVDGVQLDIGDQLAPIAALVGETDVNAAATDAVALVLLVAVPIPVLEAAGDTERVPVSLTVAEREAGPEAVAVSVAVPVVVLPVAVTDTLCSMAIVTATHSTRSATCVDHCTSSC
jgi:hypothetical protein